MSETIAGSFYELKDYNETMLKQYMMTFYRDYEKKGGVFIDAYNIQVQASEFTEFLKSSKLSVSMYQLYIKYLYDLEASRSEKKTCQNIYQIVRLEEADEDVQIVQLSDKLGNRIYDKKKHT